MRNDSTSTGHAISRRRFVAAAGAGTSLFGLAGLTAARAAENAPLVVSIGTDIVSLDPDQYASWNDYWAYGNMFEGLYGPDQTGSLVPALAESMSISPDGLTYSFTLRAGAKFHNGDPVTSDDVAFSLKRSLDPKTRNQRAALIGASIDRLEIVDATHFIVHLKQVDSETLTKLSLYWQVKPKKYIESVGDDGFAKKPVGTGPFEFVERRPDEYFKLRAFAGYWGGAPGVRDITVKIVPEEQSRLAQVMAGEADVATPISPVIAARMRGGSGPKIVDIPALLNVVLKLNPGHPETAKEKVRQALCMAIDKPTMLKSIMQGFAAPQELWCTQSQPACTAGPTIAPYPYDPQRAKALLQEANFDFSKPLKFVGQAPGRVAASKETCEAVADYLKRIGVNVDLQILEFGAWNAILNARPPKDPLGCHHIRNCPRSVHRRRLQTAG